MKDIFKLFVKLDYLHVEIDSIAAFVDAGSSTRVILATGEGNTYEVDMTIEEAMEAVKEAVQAVTSREEAESRMDIRAQNGLEYFSETVLEKASTLESKKLIQDEEVGGIWWVVPSIGKKYRVQLLEVSKREFGATCTCPNGLNKARAECYHAAAVMKEVNGE